MEKNSGIVVTGAAGLVGQNLVTELVAAGYSAITAVDKHSGNLARLKAMHPSVNCIEADLAESGSWRDCFAGADMLFMLQAQITGAHFAPFQRNTLDSTENVLAAARKHNLPYAVCVSSSVVRSVADDNYTRAKKKQEEMVRKSGLPHCILRPTLMFGWFDPKHLGWLSRLMAKFPVFPIPGSGEYVRQPLYVRDFCQVLLACAQKRPNGIYDISGCENITYIDIIREIRQAKKLNTLLINIPVPLFASLMRVYGLFSKNPPFVTDQLTALMAGDHFAVTDLRKEFDVVPTPFADAIEETFNHPKYSQVVLERWS